MLNRAILDPEWAIVRCQVQNFIFVAKKARPQAKLQSYTIEKSSVLNSDGPPSNTISPSLRAMILVA